MAKLSSPGIYSGLNSDRKEIRLILLHPGNPDDHLVADLLTVSLLDAPNYEALSYVWGNTNIRKAIRLGGDLAFMTENLDAALRRLRLSKDSRVLWIDALCINQLDLAERSSQVFLMGQIYSNSTNVVVWLGEEDEFTQSAFGYILSLSCNEHIMAKGCFADSGYVSYEGQATDCGNKMKTISRLLARSWWSRTWTLQEIVLARDANVVCGSSSITWANLVKATTNSKEHLTKCCGTKPACRECSAAIQSFQIEISGLSATSKAKSTTNRLDMMDLLSRNRPRQVTDARDKIYGLLGLMSSWQASVFVPDYTSDVESLYIKTVLHDIKWRKSLQSMNHAIHNSGARDLPTWAPDWTSSPTNPAIELSRQLRYQLFDTSKDVKFSGTVVNERYFLTDGIIFDKVRQIGDLSSSKILTDSIQVFNQWAVLAELGESLDRRYVGGGSFRDAFWRTIIFDATFAMGESPRYHRACPEDEKMFWTMWEVVTGSKKLEDIDPAYLTNGTGMVFVGTYERRLFVTETGHIGNGPSGIKPGDEVCVLRGSKCPLVLRRDEKKVFKPNGQTQPQPLNSLIGDCYLHGIMDGEAVIEFEQRASPVYIQ